MFDDDERCVLDRNSLNESGCAGIPVHTKHRAISCGKMAKLTNLNVSEVSRTTLEMHSAYIPQESEPVTSGRAEYQVDYISSIREILRGLGPIKLVRHCTRSTGTSNKAAISVVSRIFICTRPQDIGQLRAASLFRRAQTILV